MPWKETSVMDQKYQFVMKSFRKEKGFTELCNDYGITTKTGYKWIERFIRQGVEGLKEKPKRPHNCPTRYPEEVVCEIIRIKKTKLRWGPKKIRQVYAQNHPHERIPVRSSFERILKKAGFVETRKRRRHAACERIQNRIVPKHPNDLWTVDFKGWWYTLLREKCEPLTVRDEFSKFILAIEILENGDITSVKRVFERLFAHFGLPLMIRSDNGPPFASSLAILGLTKLSAWWLSLGILLDRIDPGAPYQNGAHERMHLDMKNELERKISGNLKMHQYVFNVWKDEFNNERPHESLGMKTPASVYFKSPRKYQGICYHIDYPKGFTSRQINDRGYTNYKGHRVFISNAIGGYNVGLKPAGKDSIAVWFNTTCLGEFDLNTFVFNSILHL
jgi:transposase InsO family protein